ncbi:MAG: acetylxylan esterase [Bacteroidetes bacterium]|nr:acetylxylan esterase [Bacteroidota bacterium]
MKVFLVMTLLSGLVFPRKAAAANNGKSFKAGGEVTTDLVIHDGNAIFKGTASFTFSVKNTLDTDQVGTVSYLLMTEKGVKLQDKVIKVKIDRNTNESYDFDIPGLKAGFYKINFMINVSDYDDTTRRAFGIRPEEIRSQYPKPADFDQFWQKAKDDLAKVKPDFKVKEYPDSTRDNRRVFGFEMKSLDNMTIRGWLTIPKTNNTHKKFAVLLGLPGYQVGLPPMFGSDVDLAIITLNVRGQGNSTDVIQRPRDEFLFYNLDDKNKYVMRGVIMDCVRAVDFIFSRPELRHDNILVSGGSMGGFLAIATAALDKRVTLCSAQNPILCDVHNLVGEVEWPIEDMKKYVRTVPGLTLQKALDNLDYFDVKNFATDIECPTLMGIGVLDPLAPPANEYAAYNNITAKKHIIIFKDLGHEVAVRYKNYEGRWMRDTFGLF